MPFFFLIGAQVWNGCRLVFRVHVLIYNVKSQSNQNGHTVLLTKDLIYVERSRGLLASGNASGLHRSFPHVMAAVAEHHVLPPIAKPPLLLQVFPIVLALLSTGLSDNPAKSCHRLCPAGMTEHVCDLAAQLRWDSD